MLPFRNSWSEQSYLGTSMDDLVQARGRAREVTSAAEFNSKTGRAESVLSVVIPAHNEAESLSQLVDEITQALHRLRDGTDGLDDFEIIIVDDGSTDSTQLVLMNLALVHTELRWFASANQVGQTAATMAGIRAARGNWIATLDADLQNDPADLVRLWIALPGNDAVLGWRIERKDFWFRRIISLLANWVRNLALGYSARDAGCSVRIFPRSVGLCMPTFQGMHRFFGALLQREGCRLVEVPVNHRPRSHGRSHYTLANRSLQVLIDLVGVVWLMQRTVRFQVSATSDRVETANRDTLDFAWRANLPRFFARRSGED